MLSRALPPKTQENFAPKGAIFLRFGSLRSALDTRHAQSPNPPTVLYTGNNNQEGGIMGLDMNAYALTPDELANNDNTLRESHKIHDWRKHHALNAWFLLLHIERHDHDPTDDSCFSLELTAGDLDRLEQAVRSSTLPDKGHGYGVEWERSMYAHDLDFIRKARAALAEGKTIYYSADW
jgi:hypothetical protein